MKVLHLEGVCVYVCAHSRAHTRAGVPRFLLHFDRTLCQYPWQPLGSCEFHRHIMGISAQSSAPQPEAQSLWWVHQSLPWWPCG